MIHNYKEEITMKKTISFILSIFIIFTLIVPVGAESSNNTSSLSNINMSEEQISLDVSLGVTLSEPTPRFGPGTIFYFFTVTVYYIAANGQSIAEAIEYVSTVYDCADAIYQFARDYVANEHLGSYSGADYNYYKRVVDSGCWTPDTPWNPFCRIIASSTDDEI